MILSFRRWCSIRWPVSRRDPMVDCPKGWESTSPWCPSRTLSSYFNFIVEGTTWLVSECEKRKAEIIARLRCLPLRGLRDRDPAHLKLLLQPLVMLQEPLQLDIRYSRARDPTHSTHSAQPSINTAAHGRTTPVSCEG